MKNKLYWLCGLSVILAACQSDDLMDAVVSDADEANFTITLTAPEAMTTTRTAQGTNSALGGISNVDMDEYDLRYQLAVYRNTGTDEDGNATYVLAISPQVQVVDEYQTVAYTLRLTPNRTYKFVAWADFVKEGSEDDLHYNTGTCDDNGWVITCKDEADAQLNDESRDAYYVSSNDLEVSENYSVSLELTRPFAKVRLIATDWGYEDLEMPDNITISYYGCSRFTNIDLFDGTSESETLAAYDESSTTAYTVTIDKDTKGYTEGYDGEDYEVTAGTGATYSYRTLTVDYLMTDATDQTSIHFLFDANDGTTDITSYDFSTDIPIKRNYLTTIIGNLLTTAAAINVWIDEDFDGEYTIPTGEVATYEELQLALALGVEEITLTDDIDTEGEELYIYSTTSTINLNNNTLTTQNIYYYSDDSSEEGPTLTINGGTSSTDSSGEGKIVDSYSGIILWGSGAQVELNYLTLTSKYVAVCLGFDFMSYDADEANEYQTLTVNNCTIENTTYLSAASAIHIQSHNSTVIMNNSKVVAKCIGISNASQYTVPQGCTIKLTNTSIDAYWNCIKIYTIDGYKLSSLVIDGGTFTTDTYNTIMVSNSNVDIMNATIINTSSTSSFSYLSGNCISLVPAITSATVLSYFTYAKWDTPFEGEVSLKGITYKLGKAEGKGYKVLYYDYKSVTYDSDGDYKSVDYIEYASVEGCEDGATDDSEYSYTETTTE